MVKDFKKLELSELLQSIRVEINNRKLQESKSKETEELICLLRRLQNEIKLQDTIELEKISAAEIGHLDISKSQSGKDYTNFIFRK